MSELVVASGNNRQIVGMSAEEQFVTLYLDSHMFGIPVLAVQDVIIPDTIAKIPLAPKEILGAINLRGRIVTVIDLRQRIGLEGADISKELTSITIPVDGELYSLCVDKVGDVVDVPQKAIEPLPPTVDPRWKGFAVSVVQLEGKLLTLLDVTRILDFANKR